MTPHPRLPRALQLLCVLAPLLLVAACGDDGSDDASAPDPATEAPVDAVDGSGRDLDDGGDEGDPDLAWPVPEWESVSATDAGFDEDALAAIVADAEAAGSTCLVITRDGRLVEEQYWGGSDEEAQREAFSVTKSISSTLVGIAQDRGLLHIDDPVSDYVAAWQGTDSADVTIRNLVANDSGRYQDMASDYVTLATQAQDKNDYAIGLDQQHEPGEVWVYNNAAIQVLDAVLVEATGMPTGEFAREALFEPLGMATEIALDPAGNTLTFMGAQASCRDLARFGLLFLRGGEWDGEQVVSSEWVDEATTPSTDLNAAYGYLWWLNREGTVIRGAGDATEGQLVPGAPEDLVAALGLGDQVVAILPSSGLVVARMGGAEAVGGASFGIAQIALDVPAALTDG